MSRARNIKPGAGIRGCVGPKSYRPTPCGKEAPDASLHLLNNARPAGGETCRPVFQFPRPLRQARNGVTLTAFDPTLLNDPNFMELVAHLRQQSDSCVWCTRPLPRNLDELRDEIRGLMGMADVYLVINSGVPIGFAISKRPPSPAFDHWRWVGVVIGLPHQRKGHGIVALCLLAAHLFSNPSIDRVVGETFGVNRRMLQLLDRMPAIRREGVRRNHVRVDGRLYDMHEFGVDRQEFEQVVANDPRWARLLG